MRRWRPAGCALSLALSGCAGRSTSHESPREQRFFIVDPLPEHSRAARSKNTTAAASILGIREEPLAVLGTSTLGYSTELIRWTPEHGSARLGSLGPVSALEFALTLPDAAAYVASYASAADGDGIHRVVWWTETAGFTELKTSHDSTRFHPVYASDDASVAVMHAYHGNSRRGVRLTAAGGFEDLGSFEEFDTVLPLYLSGDGRTMLAYATGEDCLGVCPGVHVKWTSESGIESLGAPPGFDCRIGQVASTSRGPVLTAICGSTGARWDEGIGWRVFPASRSVVALGRVSDDATTIFGVARVDEVNRAFRWRESNDLTILGPDNLSVWAVSADGAIVSAQFPDQETFDGYIWKDGSTSVVPDRVPTSMSAAGDRIVFHTWQDLRYMTDPVLASPDRSFIPFEDALTEAGASPGDAHVQYATILRSGTLAYGLADAGAWVARFPR